MHSTLLALLLAFTPANESLMGVKLSTAVKYQDKTLTLTGVGIGSKRIGVSIAKVAVNQFFCEYPGSFVRTKEGALQSLQSVGNMVFSITFTRGVKTSDVEEQINTVMSENMTPDERTKYAGDVKAVREIILKDDTILTNETINIVANVKEATMYYVNMRGEVRSYKPADPKFIYKVFAAWFGNAPPGSTGESLKLQLLRAPEVTPAR
ncbi:hypothetical protein EB061_07935 [bacterium]|jgi:hypothetical protein|nr:hypothetical protein [bacterium]